VKRHHNTLFVTSQGAYVSTEGETAVVRLEGKDKLQVPLHMLEGIVCFGRVSCSPLLLARSSQRGIGISFLTERGSFLARNVVLAKIANARSVLLRALRDHPDRPGAAEIRAAVRGCADAVQRLESEKDLDQVRGLEGDAARQYFGVFDNLILCQKSAFAFRGRSRRPPLDSVNALLSFAYTLVTHDAASALEVVGLDPQVGFLHCDRPGRPGLALDLVEEFRAFLADRLVLSLINRRQVQECGFVTSESGGVVMDDDARKTVLVAYQERKQEEITHPFLGDVTTVGMLVHLQALLLARFLRGDLDDYPPFVWK
jgi:CRISPR-associated protein Cas1